MENMFYSLQDFFTHTKGVTYLLIIAALIAVAAFWNFLAGRDEDQKHFSVRRRICINL